MQRKQLLQKYIESIDSLNEEGFHKLCFKILYGLPPDIQIEICLKVVAQYLPIFINKYPTISWPGEILNDLVGYVKQNGRCVPEKPDCIRPEEPEASFLFLFNGLIFAEYYKKRNSICTISCINAMSEYINARTTNVWVADDPEGFNLWINEEVDNERITDNVNVIAVQKREWLNIANLMDKNKLWDYPEYKDDKIIEAIFNYWSDELMLTFVDPEGGEPLPSYFN